MRKNSVFQFGLSAALIIAHVPGAGAADAEKIESVVDTVIRPLMAEYDVPGMAVAISLDGERHVFNHGVASRETGAAVTDGTIFEIGSISKTFTATLGAYAQASGALAMSDMAGEHIPELKGSALNDISLLQLATYTAGGLPLQFPDEVGDGQDAMIAYYRDWRPDFQPGEQRQYSNPSIGLFGYIAAAGMDQPFEALMREAVFEPLGLADSFIDVPEDRMSDYAFGYARDGRAIRVTPGLLDAQAYGVKTTASDLLRFVEANMDGVDTDEMLGEAMATTRTGYVRVGDMIQGLGWEMYPSSTDLAGLLAGNSTDMALEPQPATMLAPPTPPQPDMLVNKTGSTNGFGAYAVFIPEKRVGVVLLANRNYPNAARVEAAYEIMTALEGEL